MIPDQPNGILVFLLGSFGALAPEIVRLYRLRWKSFQFSYWYFGISLMFAILGGVVALILPATTYQAAFYAGVSAPVMISTITRRKDHPNEFANERPGMQRTLASIPRRSIRQLFQDHADGLF